MLEFLRYADKRGAKRNPTLKKQGLNLRGSQFGRDAHILLDMSVGKNI